MINITLNQGSQNSAKNTKLLRAIWQRRLFSALAIILLLTSYVHGNANASFPKSPQQERNSYLASEASEMLGEKNSNKASPPLGVVPGKQTLIEFSKIYCPSGSGYYCYYSDSGYFSIEDSFQAYNTDRALYPDGDCQFGSGNYTNVMAPDSGGVAWIIFDLGEVFEIAKFISWDLHHGVTWLEYSDNGTTWNTLGTETVSWQNEHCGQYLYDKSSSPVNARYIRYRISQLSGWGNAYRVAWFSFLSKTNSKIHPPVQYPSIAAGENSKDCPTCRDYEATKYTLDPVNTLTGGFSESFTDLSIPTAAGPLEFQRTYSTSALGLNEYTPHTDTTLGYGWTHNQDIYLTFPSANEVWFKGQTANRYQFTKNADGSFTAYPGVTASLSFNSTTNQYSLIDSTQNSYIFNSNGKVLSLQNATGQTFTYSYATNGALSRVSDPSGSRYLDFLYTNGLLTSVSDYSGRSVFYSYNANNDLITFTDVLSNAWQYGYDSGHRMTTMALVDASNPSQPQTKVRNLYDAQGRVVCQQEGDEYPPLTQYAVVNSAVVCRQADGSEAAAASLTYNKDWSVTIKDANGHSTTHTYNVNRNTSSGETDPLGGSTSQEQDGNFRPTSIVNPAGHELKMTWSADGANLLTATDPEENTTTKEYDTQNNLTKVVDPLLHETTYTYSGRLMTSMTNALNQTTTYTYTTEGELNSLGQPQPGGLLKTVTDPAERTTTYEYNPLGQKIRVTDSLNHSTHYTYDNLGRLTDTTDPQGRVTHNEYNAAGWTTRTTRNYVPARQQNDENLYNLVTEYEYDAAGHQILVRDTLGHETTYTYDKNGRLTTTTNALDQTTINVYDKTNVLVETIDAASNHTIYEKDAAGRAVITRNPLSHGSTNTYNIEQNSTTVTDALGHATVTYYDKNNRVVRVVNELLGESLTSYDGNGNVVTKTDPLGHVTFYAYDELNRVKRQVQNYDAARPQNDQNLYNIVTEYTYNAAGNQTQVKDTLGRVTYNEYDEFGRLFRQTRNYDPNRPQNDQGQYNLVTENGYDTNGNQNRVTDTYGHVTYSEYDLLGRLSRQTQNYDPNRPQNDQNQYNLVTEYRYDALGNQTKVIDPAGRVTFKEYDALSRLIKQTRNYDAALAQNAQNQYNIVTLYEYDALGRQYKVTDTYGRITYNEYDIAGQLIRVTHNYDLTKPQNDENQYNIVTSYEYDDAGHQVKEIDTYGKVTFYAYDELGRKKSKTVNHDPARPQSDGNEYNLVTLYAYDLAGHQTDETDPNGVVTHFEYDALGRMAASVQNYQPGVTPTAEINVRIEYTYDALGNRLTRKDPRSNSTTYSYDALGRLSGQTTPLLHHTTFEYDALGRIARKTDGNGALIQYGYDALGRQITIDYPSGEADVSYTYNLQGQPLTMTVTNQLSPTTWTYDYLGRMTSVTNADGSKVEYSYDALGNRLTVTTHISADDVTGKTITNTYDALNRLFSVTDWDEQQTSYAYDAVGRLKEVHRPNEVTGTYDYNSAGRLTHLIYTHLEETLAEYQYSYDPSGNRLSAQETLLWVKPGVFVPPTQFTPVEEGYMAITLAWPDSTIEETGYTLERSTDGGQNWQAIAELNANTLHYTDYGLARHTRYEYRLTAHNEQGGSNIQTTQAETRWDAVTDGSLPTTTEPGSVTITYTYDALHRLETATYTDGTAFSYTYDAAGNTLQAAKTGDGQTKTTVYTYDTDNQLETAQENGGTVWQYHYDSNGSLVETTPGSQAGNGAKHYTYNSAGQLIKVEAYDGTAYQVQAEMVYNGQGQRLALTAYQDGQSLITTYLLDGNTLLAATANGATTDYLPGIGEHKQGWSYYLTDGTNSVRQMSSPQGEVTLTRSFTPWGELLKLTGEGDFTWGYLGGVLDAATGLIYVGNGQYYDPATGRFLSRGIYPGATNPYVPWQANPAGMIIAPLALITLIRGKRKAGRIDQVLVIAIVTVAVGMTLSGCFLSDIFSGASTPTPTGQQDAPSTTSTSGANNDPQATQTSTSTSTQAATATQAPTQNTPTPIPCPTPVPTETPTPIPTPTLVPPPTNPTEDQMKEYLLKSFQITLVGSGWNGNLLSNLWEALFTYIGYEKLVFWMNGKAATFYEDNDITCKGEDKNPEKGCFYGDTGSWPKILFHHKNMQSPVINMLHEMGHWVEGAWGGYLTGQLSIERFTNEKGRFVAGQDKPGKAYVSISEDLRQTALLQQYILGDTAWQQRGGTPAWEDWADIFSNYCAGNINQSDAVGRQMYNFASRMEDHVMKGTP